MKILAVDDERAALRVLTGAISEAMPSAEIASFQSASEALAYACENGCDTAFLDIEMREMSGLQLAKSLKDAHPNTNIIFVTSYSQYMGDALSMYVSGYVMKPVTKEDVERELEHLRHPPEPEHKQKLRVQCFGNFEVFAGDTPLHFRYNRAKELFAYLIDRRGSAVNTEELIAILWEDEPASSSIKSNLRNLLSDLAHTLKEAGAEDALVKSRNCYAVNTNAVDCDYYDFLKQKADAVNAYMGEYMTQYSWAEMTLGYLERLSEQ